MTFRKQPMLLVMLQLMVMVAATAAAAADGSKVKEGSSGRANYLIAASDRVEVGRDYTVGVSLASGDSFTSVTARLFTVNAGAGFTNVSVGAGRNFVTPGASWIELKLLLPLENRDTYDLQAKYTLNVTIHTKSGKLFTNETQVRLQQQQTSLLIQTDKGIYKPGTEVRYRALTLGRGLKPIVANTLVTVRDPKRNLVYSAWHNSSSSSDSSSISISSISSSSSSRIRSTIRSSISGLRSSISSSISRISSRISGSSSSSSGSDQAEPQTAESAVSEGSLPLAEIANFGIWSLRAENDFGSQTVRFEVRNYELPRFTLTVNTPEFVHVNDSSFTVTTSVSYTFSKPVAGTYRVTLGPHNNCRSCKPSYDMLENFETEATDAPAEFKFDLANWRKMMDDTQSWPGYRYSTFNVKVYVEFTEKFTGVKKSEEKQITIYSRLYLLSLSVDESKYFLPGSRIPVVLSLKRPDGKPFTRSVNDSAELVLEYTRRGKPESMSQTTALTAAADGTGASLIVTVPANADFLPIQLKAKIINSTDGYQSQRVLPYVAYGDEFVDVKFKVEDEKKKIYLQRSSGVKSAFLLTLSGGQIQSLTPIDLSQFNTVNNNGNDDNNGNNRNKELALPWNDEDCKECVNSLPEVTLFVLGVTHTGEFVASALKQDLTNFAPNVTLTSNLTSNTGAPQETAKLMIRAQAKSLVYLSGIDHAVNLLRSGNDILRKLVLDKQLPEVRRYWRPSRQSVTTHQLLQDNNLILLTDGFYYKERQQHYMRAKGMRMSSAMLTDMRVESAQEASVVGSRQPEVQEQVRQFFPETMLWSMVQTDEEGKAETSLTLPDTITSWDLTAFALSANSPIQTMERPVKMITQKQFFIRPILPVSIVRGEQFILKVLVFNFMTTESRVNVTVQRMENFNVTALEGQKSEATDSAVSVEVTLSGSSALAAFQLQASNLSALQLKITGQLVVMSTEGPLILRDTVIRQLPVLPEGITIREGTSMLLSLNKSVNLTQSVAINFPTKEQREDLVEGSELLHYSLIGSVLGPAMQNLQKLVRMPSGCGEQNLVKFAPAVSVAQFARSAGIADSSEMVQKARRAMQIGYQRQLTFRRRDASYSAFGQRDAVGSQWLTAFSLRTFADAAEFVTVDPETVTGASLRFLLAAQGDNGQFKEVEGARVFDSSLQGEGEDGSVGMTAFVCSALIDIQQQVQRLPQLVTTSWKQVRVDRAVYKCLLNLQEAARTSLTELDAFDVAISAYTLAQAEATRFQWQETMTSSLLALRARLSELAVNGTNGGRYWQTKTSWGAKRPSVEATAYALMDSVLQLQQRQQQQQQQQQQLDYPLSILRWLTSKQTDIGGFSTTQATVVGIRALTQFAQQFSVSADARAEASVVVGPAAHAYSIDASSRWVLRQAVIGRGQQARIGQLTAAANGSGTVLITVSQQYNVQDPAGKKVQLSRDWFNASGLGLRLGQPVKLGPGSPPADVAFAVCVRADSSQSSGMHILTISNPTGFSVQGHSQVSEEAELQRVEAGDQKVVFYFSAIPRPMCVYAQWQRDVPVLNTAPQVVTLQKYYKTEEKVTVLYSAPELQAVTKCKACPDCPGCVEMGGPL